jgi:hypothetical protein
MPDHGVKWSELKPYNARLRETYRPLSWAEVRGRLSQGACAIAALDGGYGRGDDVWRADAGRERQVDRGAVRGGRRPEPLPERGEIRARLSAAARDLSLM